MGRALLQGALCGLVAAAVALLLWLAGLLTPLENLTWRWRAAWFARGASTSPIVLIALDQRSLDWGQRENGLSWPWPREAYVPILDFCQRAGVRAVAFDLLFSEPSSYGVADDQALAAGLASVPSVVAVALSRQGPPVGWPAALTPPPVAGRNLSATVPRYVSGTFPLRELGNACRVSGNVSARPDEDGIYRRFALLDRLDDQPVPALPLALLLAAEPALQVAVNPESLTIGRHVAPTDAQGEAILRFHGAAGTFPTLSAAAVIQSELRLREGGAPSIDPARLRGAYVIFGLTAPGLFDLRATPLDGVAPGMEIHATALDNLLTDGFLRDVPRVVSVLLTIVAAMVVGAILRAASRIRSILVIGAIALPLPLLIGFAAYQGGWWLPVLPQTVALAATFITLLLLNYATEGKQRRYIRQAFNQYLHPTVIEQLLQHPGSLRLGGERREITVFFSDLQGFSTFSEQLEPEALTALLNEYLSAMTDIILDRGGTVDKYVGDAIVAFWNAPLDQPDHAGRAVEAALACQARLAALRPLLKERSGHSLHMRIGINTGAAVVGNMGSQRRFDYTALGDTVNLASRLEGVNKEFGSEILLAEATARQLDGRFAVREIARVSVVGKTEPVRIFEPLAGTVMGSEGLAVFAKALSHYYAGEFAEAAARFAPLAEIDPVAGCYAQRCREMLANPPLAWDGVWRMSSK